MLIHLHSFSKTVYLQFSVVAVVRQCGIHKARQPPNTDCSESLQNCEDKNKGETIFSSLPPMHTQRHPACSAGPLLQAEIDAALLRHPPHLRMLGTIYSTQCSGICSSVENNVSGWRAEGEKKKNKTHWAWPLCKDIKRNKCFLCPFLSPWDRYYWAH